MSEQSSKQRIIAFWALVFVYLGINLVYKLSGATGKYRYSPASALALSELIKLIMSFGMVCRSVSSPSPHYEPILFVKRGFMKVFSYCETSFLGEIGGLALMYCINNNAYFWVYMHADAASIQLIKSGSSFISAFIMWIVLKRVLNDYQWLAITLQVCGLITAQWDPLCMTSIGSVWNEKIVKQDYPLNVTNTVLYAFGFMFQLTWFTLFSPGDIGFFDGYDLLGILVVVFNSFMGLAVSAVYKYADVIVKLLSTTCVTGILMILNSFMFDWKPNLTIVAGVIVVFSGTYLYMKESWNHSAVHSARDGDVKEKEKL